MPSDSAPCFLIYATFKESTVNFYFATLQALGTSQARTWRRRAYGQQRQLLVVALRIMLIVRAPNDSWSIHAKGSSSTSFYVCPNRFYGRSAAHPDSSGLTCSCNYNMGATHHHLPPGRSRSTRKFFESDPL
jgi:hypothetical protein